MHPLAYPLARLFCRPDGAFEGNDPQRLTLNLNVLLATGQWLATHDAKALWGWASWWLLSDEDFEWMRHTPPEALASANRALCIDAGPHLYIVDAVVTPWAPQGTIRHLLSQVLKTAQPRGSFGWWRQAKGRPPRWIERTTRVIH